jgi:hypothetical protein
MCNLQEADLAWADLSGADLDGADLTNADLHNSNLDGADLEAAMLEGVDFSDVRFNQLTKLANIRWGEDLISASESSRRFDNARITYRKLKVWHQSQGYYDLAGEFHFREWVCARKQAQREFLMALHPKLPKFMKSIHRRDRCKKLLRFLLLAFYDQLFGFGERPFRVFRFALIMIAVFAPVHFQYSPFDLSQAGMWEFWNRLWTSAYFSGVSFTGLGYGNWDEYPSIWRISLGVVESVLGGLLLALFLVTFTRKWMR